jgi:hypothetical protein
MPLSEAAPRKHLHTRRITVQGYARDDGLWDIEGHMTDNKTYTFNNNWRGKVTPDIPLHEMWLRLTLDDDYTVVDAEAVSDHTPLNICSAITPEYKKLKGLRVGPGWNRKVKEILGGRQGCTHLTELLGPIATVAFQTISVEKNRRRAQNPEEGRLISDTHKITRKPPFLDGCHAWATDGPAVKEQFPQFYVGPEDSE